MRYFEDSTQSLQNEKVEVVIGDPLLMIQRRKEKFDCIIVDMFTDVKSPAHKVVVAELLHGLQYLVTWEGVICFAQPPPLINDSALGEHMKMFHRYYNSVGYAVNLAPTSPQGMMGFALMSRQEGMDFSVPKQGFGHTESRELGLRCYNTEGSFMCVPSIVTPYNTLDSIAAYSRFAKNICEDRSQSRATSISLRHPCGQVHQGSFMCVPSIVRDLVNAAAKGDKEEREEGAGGTKNIYSVQSMFNRQFSTENGEK
eukprot:sb/3468576/